MPLGEKLWEEKSKTVAIKVLDVSERGIHEEVDFAGEIRGFGRLEGMEGKTVGTGEHWGRLTEGIITGTFHGTMTLGDEIVSFKAVGHRRMIKRSPVVLGQSVALIQFIHTPPNLSWLTNTLVVWEGKFDPEQHLLTATAYEWT